MTQTGTNLPATRRLYIYGDVGHPDFQVWTLRHAGRLGLDCFIVGQRAGCLEVLAEGPEELLDALALGCSLGPQTVLVDRIESRSETAEGAETAFPTD